MNRLTKICLLLGSLALIFTIAKLAWAEGNGYFLQKGNEFFIFDNLYINGFLSVESSLVPDPNFKGAFGDVLVGKNLNLDATKSFNFCKDTRDPQTTLPLNKDCATKVMIWKPDVLEIESPDFYELDANNILLTGNLELNSQGGTINTDSGIKLTGCFSNDGSNTCNTNEFKTNKLYTSSLKILNICTGTAYKNNFVPCAVNADCNQGSDGICHNNEITLSPSNKLIFDTITLGSNFAHQNLCTPVGVTTACPAGSGTAMLSGSVISGAKLCCNLKISF